MADKAISNATTKVSNGGGVGSQSIEDQMASTVAEVEKMRDLSKQRAQQAEAQVEKSKAAQAEQQAAGTSQVGTGTAQSGAGQGMQIGGQATAGIGEALIVAAQALMAVPEPYLTKAQAAAMTWIGLGMQIVGTATAAAGTLMMAQGNQAIEAGTQKLADAVNDGVVAKEQAGVASKEMQRSSVYAAKAQLLKATMDQLKSENPEMDDQQIEQLSQKLKQGFDQSFERAAGSLKNNGIMTFQDQETGNEAYFVQDLDGGFSEISVAMDSNGEPLLDGHGRLQQDQVLGKVTEDDSIHEQLKLDFTIAGKMAEMITGTEEFPTPLARFELDADGRAVAGTYDIDNPADMDEFFDIVKAANEEPPPLDFIQEPTGEKDPITGEEIMEQFFVTEDGTKVSMFELTGGEYDANDPKSVEAAQARSQEAFKKIGLDPDSARYKLLQPLVEESFNNDILGLNGQVLNLDFEIGNQVTSNVRDSILGGDFGDFSSGASFADHTRNTVQSVLDSGRFGGVNSGGILDSSLIAANPELLTNRTGNTLGGAA